LPLRRQNINYALSLISWVSIFASDHIAKGILLVKKQQGLFSLR
jgi:hypothetical protein